MSFIKSFHIKLVLVGDEAVGKTSLFSSHTFKKFPDDYIPTVFDGYCERRLFNGQTVIIDYWDTAGMEAVDHLRHLSYPQTDVFLICFSVIDAVSFDHVRTRWYPEITHHCPNTPFILVGNKVDLRKNLQTLENLRIHGQKPVTYEEGMRMAQEIDAVKYMECSCRTLEGVDEIFEEVVRVGLPPPPSPLPERKKKIKRRRGDSCRIH
jgi:small GTP-binding protein